MSNQVKIFHSGMAGAPQLSQTAGAMLGILDACLVNGWGVTTASSVVVASGICTMNFAAGHPFEVDSLALVAGATPAGLNGEQRVLSITTNTITFATALADQTATGTITAKVASAGWAKVFTGTNLAAYQSANPASRLPFLRVDDTGTLNARVVGYESMTDINTGTGPTPTAVQMSGGLYWPKANTATGTRAWALIGDDKSFYLWIAPNISYPLAGFTGFFGDILANRTNDAYAWAITGAASDAASLSAANMSQFAASGAGNPTNVLGSYSPRPVSGLGSAQLIHRHAPSAMYNNPYTSGSASQQWDFPNVGDNALLLVPVYGVVATTVGGSAYGVRGRFPGQFFTPQKVGGSNYTHLSRQSVGGKRCLTLQNPACAGTSDGVGFLDISGVWE